MVDTQNAVQTQAVDFPSNLAFVVQFHNTSAGPSASCAGRVEHLTSGHRTHFAAWEELRGFIEAELAQLTASAAPAPDEEEV